LSTPNVYFHSYGNTGVSGNNNGIRMDIGHGANNTWTRFVFFHSGGNTVYFTNSQPQGYWYLQYAFMDSGVSTGYGCSEPAGTFVHTTITPALTVNNVTIPNWIANVWGNGASFGNYTEGKVGQLWMFNRVLSTNEIEQIYANTKSRYGY
jgi:hypothetical protein